MNRTENGEVSTENLVVHGEVEKKKIERRSISSSFDQDWIFSSREISLVMRQRYMQLLTENQRPAARAVNSKSVELQMHI